jgi:hypothetical protein
MPGSEPGYVRPAPTEPTLDPDDRRTALQVRLRTALLALPSYFEFNNYISGVNATDLFSLNSLLGASIESQVLKALNGERGLWDPDDEWIGCVYRVGHLRLQGRAGLR